MKTYGVIKSSQFKKSYDLAKKRGWDISLLDHAIVTLASGERLPPENRDHRLHGKLSEYRACHLGGIKSDWVLVYRKEESQLVLYLLATGSHRELGIGS